MAEWFKLSHFFLDDPKIRFCVSKEPHSIPVFLWCLITCCRERSSSFDWSNSEPEIIGLSLILNLPTAAVKESMKCLNDSQLITVNNGRLEVNNWTKHQSDYLSRQGYYKERYKSKKTSVFTVKKSENCEYPLRGEESRGEESRGDKKGASNESRPPSLGEWLEALKKNPAYEGIDVGREYGKMCAWCETNRKQATQRRFINWLNRADKPIHSISKPIQESLSVFGLTKVIEAKQKIVTDLKNRFCSEGPLSRTWSDEQARIDCSKLCTEIKQLNTKLAKMA